MTNPENDTQALNEQILGQIISRLTDPLTGSLRNDGPTIKNCKSELTFYVYPNSSGIHTLRIGRSKNVFEQLKTFLDKKGFECKPTGNIEESIIYEVSSQQIADIINSAEAEFNPTKQ